MRRCLPSRAGVQVKEGKEPAMFKAYFQAWDASRKQPTTADYDARVAALNDEAAKAAAAEPCAAASPFHLTVA